jgi:hypothetical protein
MHDREGCIRNHSEDNDQLISTAPTFDFIENRATRRRYPMTNVKEVMMSSKYIPRALVVQSW